MPIRSKALRTVALGMGILHASGVLAYGGGSSSGSCQAPRFYDESPPKNAKIASLSEISIVLSDDTDTSTLELEVNGTRMNPELSRRRAGDWQLRQQLPQPITQNGKVRVTLTAKSKEGCATFHPYYLEITPDASM